jgi:RNA polymerase sigma-70 factor, ECF subfamily
VTCHGHISTSSHESRAADLVQDSFVRAYTRLDSCQDPARFSAWVFRILRNRCHDFLRDVRQRTRPVDEVTVLASDRDDPEIAYGRVELGTHLRNALATLPEAQREAFLLKHLDGFSYEEMAEMLDVSVSALKMRVLRARDALHHQLRGMRAPGEEAM